MSSQPTTAIVTGASQGIGQGIVKAFVERGFNVVANSRKVTQSSEVAVSQHVALVDGHIGEPATAARVEIARRIARKMSRTRETVRLILKSYDRENPDRAIFPTSVPPLDDDAKAQIYRRFRMGVSAEVLARHDGRTRSSIYRVLNEMRARRILGTKLEFIDHASFHDLVNVGEIVGPMPEPADGKAPRRPKAPRGCPRTSPASTRCGCWTAIRRCTCSAR